VLGRARLASGLILFVFVASHLANHALGVVSLGALEAGLAVFAAVWANLPAITLLTAAFATHLAIALWRLYRRRTLRLRPWEMAQMLLGFAVPLLLLEHAVAMIAAPRVHGVAVSYEVVLALMWVYDPRQIAIQLGLIMVAWLHGVIGVHFWLRIRPGYRRWQPVLFAGALILPTLAAAGFVAAGMGLRNTLSVEEAASMAGAAGFTPDVAMAIAGTVDWTYAGFALLVALALGGRGLRTLLEKRQRLPRLTYPDGRGLDVLPGGTVLETSRRFGVPHAAVCGGRGRCSTCRVRLGAGADKQPPPETEEKRVLERIGAPANVRLACQLKPVADLEVTPLVPPGGGLDELRRANALAQGQEREVAILFGDMRNFTGLSERRLPFDTVFVLNRYFESMGRAVEAAGGRLDKFIGDGVMAIFGLGTDPATANRQALQAARAMAANLETLNASLAGDLPAPLRLAIGIHAGTAIVGELGWGEAKSLTAIGDTVNTASRLESVAKERDAELVVSARVAELAGVDLEGFTADETPVKGRREPVVIRVVERAADLPL